MSVYLIRCGENGPVKIGWAVNVEKRVRELQCAHHEELTVIRELVGGPEIEGWLHRRFSAQRIRNEWFRSDPAMLTVEPPAIVPSAPIPQTEEVFAAFGGKEQIQAITGAQRNAVNNWLRDGIPFRHWPALIREANRRGLAAVTLDTLGSTRPEAA